MKSFKFIIILFFTVSFTLNAQNDSKANLIYKSVADKKINNVNFLPFTIFDDSVRSTADQHANSVKEGIVLTLNQNELDSLNSSNVRDLELEIPFSLSGENMVLELFEAEVFSPDIIVRTSDGRVITDDLNLGKHYRGVISGDNTSLVSISLFADEVSGFISNSSGTYTLGKLKNSENQHILYKTEDLLQEFNMTCETIDDGKVYNSEDLNFQKSTTSANNCVKIYVEAGDSVYNGFGGDINATATYLSGLFAQSYVLYANEGIAMQTSDLFIWTIPDPYTSNTSGGQLSGFQSNTSTINADLGHLVELESFGGVAAGFNGICNPNVDSSLCYSGINNFYNDVPTYSWSVLIITHEMGHLLGSRHTHACVWNGNGTAIDGCAGSTEGSCALPGTPSDGGTIMSYCHLTGAGTDLSKGFHPQPSAVINNNVNNTTNCLTSCSDCEIAEVPTNVSAGQISDTFATIVWDEVDGAIYDIRYRQTNTLTWIDVFDRVINSIYLDNLMIITEYEVQVRSKCSNGSTSDYSESYLFKTTYCQSTSSNVNDEYISNFSFADINNDSGNENEGYSDFTSIVGMVKTGSTIPLSITPTWPGTIYPEGYAVWIDYNQDGDFEDSNELVFEQSPTTATPVTGNIDIPLSNNTTIKPGITRMRVSLKYNDIPNPCELFTWGEVEDYSLVIYDDFVHYNNGWMPNAPTSVINPSTATENILIVNGEPNLEANTIAQHINIAKDAVLNVEATLSLNGDLSNDGNLIFKSDAAGSGQLDVFTGTITGSGEVSVERFIPAGNNNRRAYRLLSSALNSTESINANWQEGVNNTGTNYATDNKNPNPGYGTHITGGDASLGFDQSGSNNPSMFTFNNGFVPSGSESQFNAWTALTNTNSKKLKAGEAYLTFVRGDRSIDVTDNSTTPTNTTLRAIGSLQRGNITFSSTNNSTLPEYGLSDQEDLFSLVGNPYQAIVDINNLDFTNINSNAYWVWDPNLGVRGNYTTVSLPSGANTSSSPANQFIQPGQSFFVQTLNNAASSLVFNEDDKTVSGGATAIFSQENESSLKLLLYTTAAFNTGEREADGLLINFSEDANNAIDVSDADKLQGPDESLARLQNNELISIEHRAMPVDSETLTLSTKGYTTNQYTFVVNASNIQNNFEAYLMDNYTGELSQLNEGSTVLNFTVDTNIPESIAADRFSIVFDNTTLGISDNSFGANFSLYPNPTEGQFSIKTPNLIGEVRVIISNLLGQKVLIQELSIESQQVNMNAGNLSAGTYIVELHQNKNKFISKLIVK